MSIFSLKAESVKWNLSQALEQGVTASAILQKRSILHKLQKAHHTEKFREYFPKVGIHYYGLKNLNENKEDSIYRDIRIQFQQMVYDGGETSHQLDILQLGTRLSELEILAELRTLEWKIQKSYFKYLTSLSKLYMHSQNKIKSQKIVEETSDSFKAGFKPKIQVLESLVYYRQSELQYKKALQETIILEMELKNLLNLEKNTKLQPEENLLFDFFLNSPPEFDSDELQAFLEDLPLYNRQLILVKKSKKEKEYQEFSFRPKFYIGGYYGQNSPDYRPLRNETYGVNFSVVMPLGTSSLQNQSNYGVQAEGTGIQRIPGFGPQYVGKGDNFFTSSGLQLFDNFSQSRKVLEGEINVLDNLEKLKWQEKETLLEIHKSLSRLKENHELIRLTNSKLMYGWELLQIQREKYRQGMLKPSDYFQAELEFLRVSEELATAILEYIQSNLDFIYNSGWNPGPKNPVVYKKNAGNSLFSEIQKNDPAFFSDKH